MHIRVRMVVKGALNSFVTFDACGLSPEESICLDKFK